MKRTSPRGTWIESPAMMGIFSLNWWRSPRNQFGLKMAMGCGMALYLAEMLALPSPVWSLLTVMILMLANYVGAVAEKSLMRAVGTIVGGVVGFLLVGNLIDRGPLFLFLTGTYLAFCIYFFGGTRYPYAFLLAGLTLVVIVSKSMFEPEQAWLVTIDRVQEILLGVVCSLVVSSIFWPRYARKDFQALARNGFLHLVDLQRKVRGPNRVSLDSQPEAEVMASIGKMRGLMTLGIRESVYFKADLGNYAATIGQFSALTHCLAEYAALEDLYPDLPATPAAIREKFWESWRQTMQALAEGSNQTDAADERLKEFEEQGAVALQYLRKKQDELIGKGCTGQEMIPVASVTVLTKDLLRITRETVHLQAFLRRNLNSRKKTPSHPIAAPPIDSFWIQNGIRAGLVTVAALLFVNWINPPGGGLIPLLAFFFTVMSRNYLGSRGDIGVFTNLVRAALYGIPWAAFVLLISPLLTNYLWMNLFLGASMFFFGWFVYPGLPSIKYQGNLVLNALIATFSLNFQELVTFNDVSSTYLGAIMGMGFAAVFQRLLWPVLPQREFRDAFRDCLGHLAALLDPDKLPASPEAIRSGLLLSLTEVRKWSDALLPPEFPAEEVDPRNVAIHSLRRLARVTWAELENLSSLPELPGVQEKLAPALKNIRRRVRDGCLQVDVSLRKAKLEGDFANLEELANQLAQQAREFFPAEIWKQHDSEIILPWLAAVALHQMLGIRFHHMVGQLQKLHLPVYSRDAIL